MALDSMAEMILTLPDFEDETELYEWECDDWLLICTDCRIILRYNVDKHFEDRTFYIIDIKWIAYSELK